MSTRRGMTLAELLIALAITTIVGAGVVAMTDAVARVLEEGRSERERTIASAAAATRLTSIVAPCSCALEVGTDTTVLWRGDTRRDGNVQASELGWVRHDPATNELLFEWVEFPSSWSARDREDADRTCDPDENWSLVRSEYLQAGHLSNCVLLDGLAWIEPAIPAEECSNPLSVRRLAWRLGWEGIEGIDSSTVVAGGLHAHAAPEGDG